ncbi:MAG: hypothetical protein K2P94_04330 [Rhodospirillaceae bacterium]|nr:hypothetical protein [Rhodospirillaceae bacterium]
MVRSVRSGLIAGTLFCAAAFAFSGSAEARSTFFFSANIGLPIYAEGTFAPGWYHRPVYYPRPIYAPRYYAPRPIYYPRPYYRPYYGPIVSLGLFPGPVGTVLTQGDRDIYYRAYRGALAAPIGQSMVWNSDRVRGAVTTTRDGWAGQRYCREFRQEITIDGRNEEAYGTACQTPDGDWQLVANP